MISARATVPPAAFRAAFQVSIHPITASPEFRADRRAATRAGVTAVISTSHEFAVCCGLLPQGCRFMDNLTTLNFRLIHLP